MPDERNCRASSPRDFSCRTANASRLPALAGVEFHDFAGLGVLQNQPAQLRQFQFVAVGDLHGHDIVLAVRHAAARYAMP